MPSFDVAAPAEISHMRSPGHFCKQPRAAIGWVQARFV